MTTQRTVALDDVERVCLEYIEAVEKSDTRVHRDIALAATHIAARLRALPDAPAIKCDARCLIEIVGDGFIIHHADEPPINVHVEALGRLRTEITTLRAALVRAREDMEGWGAYAGEYFQEKWDLSADLKAIDEALGETKP